MDKNQILTYIKQIGLFSEETDIEEKKKKVLTIYNDISQYSVSEASKSDNEIAILFCRNTEQLKKEYIDIKIKEALISAFDNICQIANENKESGELKTFYFLNKLYSSYKNNISPDYTEQEKNDFEKLLDNLGKIDVIFGLTDEKNKEYFPISSLLYNIIKCEDLKNDLNKSKTIQTLMLALQIYKQYPDVGEFDSIKKYLEGLNLEFVNYLIEEGTKRIGGVNWEQNYEKNGSLILYSPCKKRILIRNIRKEYFNISREIIEKYNMSDIRYEKNNKGENIAFYVEYDITQMDLNDLDFIDIVKLIENDKKDKIVKLLYLIYDDGYYNIVSEMSLFYVNDELYPVNPFCKNDEYTIIDSNNYLNGLQEVSEWLKRFGLFVLVGNGIDVINLGTLVSLEQINHVNISMLKLNENNMNFNRLLSNWIENCKEDKFTVFNKFLGDYIEKLKYITSKPSLFEKRYENDYYMPYCIDEEILKKIGFDEHIWGLTIHALKVEFSLFDNNYVITNINTGKDYSDYQREYLEGFDEDTLNHCEILAAVDDVNKTIYFSEDIEVYNRLINTIKQHNIKALPYDLAMTNSDVDTIVKMMECFENAISKIHGKIPIKDVARYRIAHHLLLIEVTRDNINKWIKLLSFQQIIKYDIAKLPFVEEEGVLYVPKDRSNAYSTYKYIYQNYLSKVTSRDIIDIYDQKISMDSDDCYCINSSKITKIVFLFDLVQKGTATKNTIKCHLEGQDNDKLFEFFCNGNKIKLYDIIEKNNPKILLHFIYAGETGIEKVKDFMNEKYKNIDYEIIDPINKLDSNKTWTEEKSALCKEIYGEGILGGNICIDDYPIVREFNQPKHNIMSNELMNIEKVVALFCKKDEL